MVQGFALGGEVGPTTAFLLESAPPERRGFYTAFQFWTQDLSVMVAGLVGFALSSLLDEQQLASRFGASRTPVREALRQLSTSGLVEIRPRRGVFVTRLSPERMMEMFETAAEMEALCVRLATYRMTPLERARIVELHQASQVMVEANDVHFIEM